MPVATTGTVLAMPGDVVLYTSTGLALGFEVSSIVPWDLAASMGGTGSLNARLTIVKPPPPTPGELALAQGKYRPLTWPSYGRPWRQ